ncbi:MAG: TlpA disulfide reductase family protein [Alphaproteobacteria bacterium]
MNVIFQNQIFRAAPRRWAGLCLIGAGIVAGILVPPPPPGPAAGPLVRGEIQHFRLLGNPRPVPEVSFTDARGKVVRLARFRGKVVLLNFWATWCAPCRREMPALDRLQETLGGPRFEVVALSLDRSGLKAVRPYFQEIGLKTLAVYLDPRGKVQRIFNITRFPTTVLIDARGFEVGRVEGPAEWMAPEARALVRFFMDQPS